MKTILLKLAVFLLVCLNCSGQLSVDRMRPSYGPIGTPVTISGAGFDSGQGQVTVTVDGTPANVQQTTSSNVVFQIAPGTLSGEVVISKGDETVTNRAPFMVTRIINGRLALPGPLRPQDFSVSAMNTFITPAAQTGEFQIEVPSDRISLIFAQATIGTVSFMAVVRPADTEVVVDARSTAIATLFLNPLIGSRLPSKALARIAQIASNSDIADLATVINASSLAGADYLNHPEFDPLVLKIIEQLLTPSEEGFAQIFSAQGPDFIVNLNKDTVAQIPSTALRLKAEFSNTNKLLDTVNIKISNAQNSNPVDWYIEIFELDKTQFPGGRNEFRMLKPQDNPRKVGKALKSVVVHAELRSANLDLVDLGAKFLTEALFSPIEPFLAPNEIRFNRERGGVYVAEAYSGNLWYGLSFFRNNQSDLIDQVGGNYNWLNALAANLVIGTIDVASIFLPVDAIVDDPQLIHKLMHTVFVDVRKAWAAYQVGGLDSDTAYDLLKTTTQAVIKTLLSEIVEKASEAGTDPDNLSSLAQKVGKKALLVARILGKTIDAFGKVSSGLQAVERTAGLTLPLALAIERYAWIIGDPFEPVITDFHPKTGRGGDVVIVQGRHFPPQSAGLVASFCEFLSTEVPPRASAELEAEILESSATSLAIRVPTNWQSKFPHGNAYICLKATNQEYATSTRLLDIQRQRYTFLPPPQIFEVFPNPATSQGVVTFRGTNFALGRGESHEVLVNGSTRVFAHSAGSNLLTFTLPTLPDGTHTLTVRLGGTEAETPLQVVVVNPPVDTPSNRGLSITVTRLDQSNSADGEVSLQEAFLMASGTLGRPIEQHDPREFLSEDDPNHIPYRRRETDNVSGDGDDGSGGGPASVDFISVAASLFGQTIFLNQPLPAVTNHDHYQLRIIIDGAGAGAQAVGWLLDGTEGVRLEHATLRNFKGNGVHILNGGKRNRIDSVRVENSGGTGVYLEESAEQNQFMGLKVAVAGRHGIHLAGAGVRHNAFRLPGVSTPDILGSAESCAEHGVLIENSASFNIVHPGTVRSNGLAGVMIRGNGTSYNLLGRQEGSLPRASDIHHNLGPGIHILNAPHNVVRFMNPAGNNGDGVLLEGPECAYNQVDGTRSGVNSVANFSLQPLPNQGNGLRITGGAHHNLIGSRIPGSAGGRNAFAGNRDDGVLIEGATTAYNTVNRSHIGSVAPSSQFPYFPNGGNGIRIRGGSHHNVLGDLHTFLDLHVMASPNAGILIEGAGSDHNEIIGCQIGTDHQNGVIPASGKNRIGIAIRNGAKANVIGREGEQISFFSGSDFDEYLFGNLIANSTEAGIVLDDCGGHINHEGVFESANRILNNSVGEEQFGRAAPNHVGIKIMNGAEINVIGGNAPEHGNLIVNNDAAGILITNNVLADPILGSAITYNIIAHTGELSPAAGGDIGAGPPWGVGIMVTGGSARNRIGTESSFPNDLYSNEVGIYLDNSDENVIEGNLISDNYLAGIVVRRGYGNQIGGVARDKDNSVLNSGVNPGSPGILLIEGGANLVYRNTIANNSGSGIQIESSSENIIGYGVSAGRNLIIENQSHGIHLTGNGSERNHIRANLIGIDEGAKESRNLGAGIYIGDGASDNLIGGTAIVQLPGGLTSLIVGNEIRFNEGGGVVIDGTGASGNSILNNDISENSNLGIDHINGGNRLMPSPLQLTYDGIRINGTVADLAITPPGSLIQLFSDPGPGIPEGAQFIGEARVRAGGTWSAPLIVNPLYPHVTMTATHATEGSTSEFGSATAVEIGFSAGGTNNNGAVSISPGANQFPALRFVLQAHNADVRVESLRFAFEGTLNVTQNVSAIRLFHDADRNGLVTPLDRIITGVSVVTNLDNQITLELTNAIVQAGLPEHWIVALSLNAAAPVGSTLRMKIVEAAGIDAEFVNPIGVDAQAVGGYPITSAQFTIEASTGQTFALWKSQFFTAGELADPGISGLNADPDGDGVSNIYEYAFNMNPKQPDRGLVDNQGKGLPKPGQVTSIDPSEDQIPKEYFTITYVRRKEPVDLAYFVDLSVDLDEWTPLTWIAPENLQVSQTDVGDGLLLETVTVRTREPMKGAGALPYQFLRIRIELEGI
ncbi:MAG: right-handed parallel beta-helix repeat-containing protein [Verrucomicrobiota bacterium]|nr:right-handed parallel beta-helix repeat-containing protein [Verrucomicrobiota bacterium]